MQIRARRTLHQRARRLLRILLRRPAPPPVELLLEIHAVTQNPTENTSTVYWSLRLNRPPTSKPEYVSTGHVDLPTVAVPASPDCRADKHRACDGDSWNPNLEQVTLCPCPCHSNPARKAN